MTAVITCPCGFQAQGDPATIRDQYNAHDCLHHIVKQSNSTARIWAGAFVIAIIVLAVAAVCISLRVTR